MGKPSSRARKPFDSAQFASELRAAMLAARLFSRKQQHLPISSACEDYAMMVTWGEAMRMGLVLSGEVPARGGALDEALEAVLSNSFDLVTMLRQPRWGLNIGAGMPSTLNPLLLMHERLARSVELLLLVRTRAAPMLPPEIWALVVQQVLSIPCDNGGGGNGDHSSGSDGGGGGSGGLRLSSGGVHSLWDEGSACGGRRPVLRHYGFGSDGTLRLALDPPLHLPHLKRFRACVAAALDAVLSRGPIEPEAGRGGAWGGSTWGGAAWGGQGEGQPSYSQWPNALSEDRHRSAWRSVRTLIASFALPVPRFALGPPAVAVRSSVFLIRVDSAKDSGDEPVNEPVRVPAAASLPGLPSAPGTPSSGDGAGRVVADQAADDAETGQSTAPGGAPSGGAPPGETGQSTAPRSRFEGVCVRIHIGAVRLRGLVAETAAAATGS